MESDFFEQKDLHNIEKIIDKKAIDATYWRKEGDLDLKRRKEAEFLVEKDIPITAIIGWVVFSEEAKESLISIGITANTIYVKPTCYF